MGRLFAPHFTLKHLQSYSREKLFEVIRRDHLRHYGKAFYYLQVREQFHGGALKIATLFVAKNVFVIFEYQDTRYL